MRLKVLLLSLSTALCVCCSSDPNLYKDPNQPTEKRIESLISQMTLEEKLGQMNILVMGKNDNANNTEDVDGRKLTPELGAFIYYSTDVDDANALQQRAMEQSRLGIPVLLGHDVIHGYRTLFPMPLAQACSWNRDLVYEASRVAAKESYLSGLRWSFSPMVDVARDGRWGRVAESYGEDPYTNSEFATMVVKGYQGDNLSDKYAIASCLKHFAGYAYSQSGRDYNPVDISDLSIWESVLPPFQAAINAGAVTVMSAFHDLNGEPIAGNREMLTEVLRNKLGFDHFVVSDWRSLEQLITQRVAADSLEASVMALKAGNDMDMYDYIYSRYLPEAVEKGLIDITTIDEAVRRILKVKFELGLFEHPYTERVDDSDRYLEPHSVEVAKSLAEQSMVLLKNDHHTLPMSNDIKRVVLVGPMVKDRLNMMGTWRSHALPEDVVTLYEGLTAEFGERVEFTHVDGAGLLKNTPQFATNFAHATRGADMVVVALGEQNNWSGENGSKAQLELPTSQVEVVKMAARTGLPVVVLTSSGRPLALSNIEPHADTILQMWQPGLYGGCAVAGILSGRVNPSGRLAITFPYSTGQLPLFYNYRINARLAWGKGQSVYKDAPTEPLYPFGYGLSYTEYLYSPIKASTCEFTANEKITLSVEVHNTGVMDGEETLFWFVDDCVATTSQPVKKLKYFEKKSVPAGERVTYQFEIDPMRDLSFVDRNGNTHLECGDFYIIVKDQCLKITLRSPIHTE